MKKNIALSIVLLAMVWFSGCAWFTPPPYVNQEMEIVKDENGKVIKSKYARSVKGLTHEDPGTVIQEWVDADQVARGINIESSNCNSDYKKRVRLKIRNRSSYAFEVTSGEFKGLTLAPGEISLKSRMLPIGAYTLKVKFIDDSQEFRDWDVNRIITAKTKFITLKNVRR
ncbi:hypothetical protein KAU19_07030 [Candidatus Parcubacteria bacterium]|nr:hypothetical protein [Candidatus Parcubacteria bacterium]